MFGMGSQELFIILLIGLVLFGGSKLPELARSLGRSVSELKKGMREEPEDTDKSGKTPKSGA
jgi:sec-independent protein translocase protein TatA